MAPDDSAVGTSIDNARAAIIQIDSLYKRAHGISGVADGVLDAALSTKTDQARDLLDGYCTIINMFITGWREALPDHEMDVLSGLIPVMVSRFRQMTTTVAPSTIPTMAAVMTAAAIVVSPNLWRAQHSTLVAGQLSHATVQAGPGFPQRTHRLFHSRPSCHPSEQRRTPCPSRARVQPN